MANSDSVPEGYLERRAEIHKQDAERVNEALRGTELVAGINRFLETGISKYCKRYLVALGRGDLPIIRATLGDWVTRGFASELKPFDEADDADVVIEMLKFVDTGDGTRWPPLR